MLLQGDFIPIIKVNLNVFRYLRTYEIKFKSLKLVKINIKIILQSVKSYNKFEKNRFYSKILYYFNFNVNQLLVA